MSHQHRVERFGEGLVGLAQDVGQVAVQEGRGGAGRHLVRIDSHEYGVNIHVNGLMRRVGRCGPRCLGSRTVSRRDR